MASDVVSRLEEHKNWLAGLIQAHQAHREALRDGPVRGDAALNNLAIENLEQSYEFTCKLLAEARGEVIPEKD